MQAITIGLDIAKTVFQVHGEDAAARVVVQKRLGRKGLVAFFEKLPPCVVALPAGRRIPAVARSWLWGTMCGCFRRLM